MMSNSEINFCMGCSDQTFYNRPVGSIYYGPLQNLAAGNSDYSGYH